MTAEKPCSWQSPWNCFQSKASWEVDMIPAEHTQAILMTDKMASLVLCPFRGPLAALALVGIPENSNDSDGS